MGDALPGNRRRRAAAWGVHAYTAVGLPLAFFSVIALFEGDVAGFWLLNCTAVFVDATDGTLARRVKVREVLPQFDGRRLDDIVDFITFAFLPSLALWRFDMLPVGLEWFAALPMLASGYGFCQERAKTDDSFVGFPSYWNIVVLYMELLGASPWVTLYTILALCVLVFVPIHYLYPTKTRLLRPVTMGLGSLWAGAMVVMAFNLEADWVRKVAAWSMLYPAYYLIISLVHHMRVVRASEVAS
ncbi:MAG: phosphatidylcholine synthase [Myxococcota bacterium]|jgi:phosphatidylcholine synthase